MLAVLLPIHWGKARCQLGVKAPFGTDDPPIDRLLLALITGPERNLNRLKLSENT